MTLLGGDPRFAVVGSYANAESALRDIPDDQAEVVLLDLQLPRISGIDCLRQLKAKQPQLKIVVLTKFEDADRLFNALRAGADGYLLKRFADRELATAIVEASEGGAPMSGEVAVRVLRYFRDESHNQSRLECLSPRERQTLEGLARACSYKEIARQLGLSRETVNGYIKAIYKKLHVHSSIDAIRVLQGGVRRRPPDR